MHFLQQWLTLRFIFNCSKMGVSLPGSQNCLYPLNGLSTAYKFVIIQHSCFSTPSGRKTGIKGGGVVKNRVSTSQFLGTSGSFFSSRLREPARGPIYIAIPFNCEDLGCILSLLGKKLFTFSQKVPIWLFLCPDIQL